MALKILIAQNNLQIQCFQNVAAGRQQKFLSCQRRNHFPRSVARSNRVRHFPPTIGSLEKRPAATRLKSKPFFAMQVRHPAPEILYRVIHMNGRVYDPTLGRMLQADPFIQAPRNTQSYNRYSYVMNNPLVYTDPSGYNFFRKVVGAIANGIFGEALASQFPVFRPILQLAACASGNPIICAGSAFGNSFAAGGSINDSLKSGGFAYLSVNAFNYIGGQFMGEPGTVLARGGFLHGVSHGVTGGVLSELQGGEFGHGFISAGVSFGTGHLAEGAGWSTEVQFTATVIAGGTVSEITGGKFSNGAMTAAFAFIFNQSAHPAQERRIRSEFTENMSEMAFDENGRAITKRGQYGADEWISFPGIDEIASRIVRRSLLVDVQVKVRTTGEFQRFDHYSREVRTILTYTDSVLGGDIDRYFVGNWERTGGVEWRPTFYNVRQYPVGGRICPVNCGVSP